MDNAWHDEVEHSQTVDETVACVRRVLGALHAGDPDLPRACDPSRIRGDADIDDLTFKLSPLRRVVSCDPATLESLFDFVLHASLHIAHLNRARAAGNTMGFFGHGQMRQMN